MTCGAQQKSDQMVCAECDQSWDVNDPYPPKCLLRRGALPNLRQSRLESVLEITMNYLSGFIVAYLVYEYIVIPYPELLHSAFWVTMLFTVVSVIRTYIWRRFFNAGLHKVAHGIAKAALEPITNMNTGPK